MSGEEILYATLMAGSPSNPVTAIIGDRIYPIVVPEGKALPAIAYQRINTDYTNTIGSDALAARVTFDVFCVGQNFSGAENLANAVATVLQDNADEIVKINRSHTYDTDTGVYAVIVTIDLWE